MKFLRTLKKYWLESNKWLDNHGLICILIVFLLIFPILGLINGFFGEIIYGISAILIVLYRSLYYFLEKREWIGN